MAVINLAHADMLDSTLVKNEGWPRNSQRVDSMKSENWKRESPDQLVAPDFS
ncbi:Uncharacterized protein DAT39_014720 [Clarias magur]|uniref:Uncharacterized protein n=1 Tax=Clarias magur TaxID=1594786 RepID=A0A8J4XCJ8_CLAMG|nr:Uncharacterized protein DAT39_014720 [Clarias magur]